MGIVNEIILNVRARIALINIITSDEQRVLRALTKCIKDTNWPQGCGVYTWDIADQFTVVEKSAVAFSSTTPVTPDTILNTIDDFKGSAVFVLKDFHFVWEMKKTPIRKLRNMAHRLPRDPNQKTIIILTPSNKIPEELKADMCVIYDSMPDFEELNALLEKVVGATGMLRNCRPALRDKIVSVSLGLSELQAEKVFRKAIIAARDGVLSESCLNLIMEEKQKIIKESGSLEFITSLVGENEVGGLEVLKKWLSLREKAFSDSAKEYGLEAPRGLALIGIPGTGKSLCAKVAASMWRMPLLRLDMGAVFSSALGSSEKNIRDAIQISEVISPCILWIDEIEKAFSISQGDSGTSSRVLGTFLTWMQEKKAPVAVLVTANNVERLHPALLRKGRFDEIFFLDLPTSAERKKILNVHLRKKKYSMIEQNFNLALLAKETEGFVGAEIEAVVKDAMFPAFLEGERPMATDDLLKSIKDMVPLAISHKESIAILRKWVTSGLARNASKPDDVAPVKIDEIRATRVIDI